MKKWWFWRDIVQILAKEDEILSLLKNKTKPRRIALALPAIFKEGKLMSNLELKSDTIEVISIQTKDAGGDVVDPPSGDTFTATSSNPASLLAEITTDASGKPAVKLTPLVQASPGITVTVADSGGLTPFTQVVDVVKDLSPTNIVLDIADAVVTSQPTPTNPGP